MQTNKKDPMISITTALEQLETLLSELAPSVAGYYEALIASGCPHELAEDLCRDWHTMFWESQYHDEKYEE